ncbi:MAG: SCO family protein [Gammaproteobacteria bacterium]
MTARPRFLLAIVALAVIAGALGAASAHWLRAAREPKATVLDTPRPLPEFELVDHHGRPFERSDLDGRWSILFFGFTNCPDVCPVTLQTLAEASDRLDDLPDARRPRVVFVSVDPARDDASTLARYVTWFDPRFTGVTGELARLQALTDGLGVAVRYVREPAGVEYTVDHTAAVFLVDPEARLRAIFTSPHDASQFAQDYRLITEGRG